MNYVDGIYFALAVTSKNIAIELSSKKQKFFIFNFVAFLV